jgi:hypothetical protein
MAMTDNKEQADYNRFKAFKENESSKGKFSWSAPSGNVLGFSGIPGVTNAQIKFGKKKPAPIQSQQFKKKEEPTKNAEAPKPVKGKNATISDIEAAVRKGFITPDEATGGGVNEKWHDAGTGKATKIEPMSKNYATKMGKAQAESQANGTPLGKQFTGPTSMKIETGRKAGFGEKIAPVNLDN